MSEIVCSKEKRRKGENFSKADLVFLCELVEKNITGYILTRENV
jgi:hypothetical protein